MFTQFNDITESSLKPFEKLFELNISTANTVAHQHSLLLANVIDDGLELARNISTNNNFASILSEQRKYSSAVYHDTIETFKQSTITLAQAQKEAELIFKQTDVDVIGEELDKTAAKKNLQTF